MFGFMRIYLDKQTRYALWKINKQNIALNQRLDDFNKESQQNCTIVKKLRPTFFPGKHSNFLELGLISVRISNQSHSFLPISKNKREN